MGEPAEKQPEREDLEKVLTHPAFQGARDLASSEPDKFHAAMKTIETNYIGMEQELALLRKVLEEEGKDGLAKLLEKERQARIGLQNEVDRLKLLAIKDGMTGAYNHTYFMEQIETEVKEAKRYNKPLSLIMLDIDHFKGFNDTYGHQVGDYVLKQLTEIAHHVLRGSDKFARYGGEEFAVILPQTDIEEAEEVAERLREAVKNTPLAYDGEKLNVTISLGVASLRPESADNLINKADKALYVAKAAGRDCTVTREFAENELGVDLAEYQEE